MNKQNNKPKFKPAAITYIMIFMTLMIITGSLSTSFSLHLGLASGERMVKNVLPADNKIHGNKGVFDAVSSLSSTSNDGLLLTNENANNTLMHQIEMQIITLSDGQPAYRMISHIVHNGSSQTTDLTSRYSKLATIPGPTIVVNEGDNVKVKITNLNDTISNNEEFTTSRPGTFLYIDNSKMGENGLFGAVIVNPKNNTVDALADGHIQQLSLDKIDKDIVVFMVGSTFWGMEIDKKKNDVQVPLWTNPVFTAIQDQKIRFHVLGVGHVGHPTGHRHTFHLHAHRWIDPGTNNIIDVKKIIPGKSHVFVIDAGDGVGPGFWQYHCHVFAHMEAGMTGSFRVISGNPNVSISSIPGASPNKNFASFEISDEPGKWFKNLAGDITKTGTESLAVINKTGTVNFMMSDVNGVHTITNVVYPKGAVNMPFDEITAYAGGAIVQLKDPGLYVFGCKLHPFMLASVIVDDPSTTGLDLGNEITLINGITAPTSSDLATRLLKLFFTITAPSNWQDYTLTNPWHVSYPNVDVRITNGSVVNLKDTLESRYGQDLTLDPIKNPSISGVGQVWIDTQFEKTSSKTKPGTATAVNTTTWEVTKKVGLPEINMNNPHNMWTDRDQNLIYQTQWFDNKTAIFNRSTGEFINNVDVGDDPSHVMTSTTTDELYVALHGEQGVAVLSPKAESVKKVIPLQFPGQDPTHPHGHWMDGGGDRYMVTPDEFAGTSTIYDMKQNKIIGKVKIGSSPIAVGMTPDGNKSYVADFFDSTISVIDTTNATLLKKINLLENYDPIVGNISGPMGFLPIQTPVSPDGQYMVTANTGSGTITIVDTETDELVKSLPCSAGCHGVNFGAKKGGGYYAYISSSFSNDMIVVDGDPNNDGNPSDAMIVGRVVLIASPETQMDDTIAGLAGTGGQGVLAIPNVYNGWVQNLPDTWKYGLTEEQTNPLLPLS